MVRLAAAWMGGEFGREWIHEYVWLSPLAVHLKLSQHFEPSIPQYKMKSCLFFFLNRHLAFIAKIVIEEF